MKSGVRWLALGAVMVLAGCSGPQDMLTQGEGTSARGLRVAGAAMAGGLPQAALNATRQVLERDPNNVAALIQQAEALGALGQADAAGEAYRRILSRDASPSREQARLARLGLGRSDLSAGRAGPAEATYRELVAANPKDASGHVGLGIALDQQGRHKEAQGAYRTALGLNDAPSTRANLGLSLAMSGDTAGAVDMLRPLASDPSATPRVRHNLAFALAMSGDRAGAERALAPDMPREQVVAALSGFDAFRSPPMQATRASQATQTVTEDVQ